MEDYFKLERRVEGKIPIVEGAGQVDVYTAPELKQALKEMLDEGTVTVIVDVSQVSYIDSHGYGTLSEANKRFQEKGGGITIVGPADPESNVRRGFKILGLDKSTDTKGNSCAFDIFDSVGQALEVLK